MANDSRGSLANAFLYDNGKPTHSEVEAAPVGKKSKRQAEATVAPLKSRKVGAGAVAVPASASASVSTSAPVSGAALPAPVPVFMFALRVMDETATTDIIAFDKVY